MECTRFNELSFPFVDGELDAPTAAEAKLHVEQCPACAASAENILDLKGKLKSVFDADDTGQRSSADLRDAIQKQTQSQTTNRALGIHRFTMPLAMAAAIGFVWLVSPFFFETTPSGRPDPVDARWVSAVENRHIMCVQHGDHHHRQGLSRELGVVQAELARELGIRVLAPDLTEAGFSFHSADTCGFGDQPGAHLIYRRRIDGKVLSLFSVTRMEALRPAGNANNTNRAYFTCVAEKSATVLAWHESSATYVLCGDFTRAELTSAADVIDGD